MALHISQLKGILHKLEDFRKTRDVIASSSESGLDFAITAIDRDLMEEIPPDERDEDTFDDVVGKFVVNSEDDPEFAKSLAAVILPHIRKEVERLEALLAEHDIDTTELTVDDDDDQQNDNEDEQEQEQEANEPHTDSRKPH
jgi:hypothetical protein